MSEQNKQKNNSIILNLESLTKEYDTLLIQYNQVQSDYINYIQQRQTTLKLATVPNSTFWGTSGISSSNVSSVEQCSALCSRTPGCSGATYNVTNLNNSQNNCWLRSGNGMVVVGTSGQYAIIPQEKEYLLTLQTLNSQLINANNKILKVFQKYESIPDQDTLRVQKNNLLKQNYKKLEKERLSILKQLEDHESIEQKQNEGKLIVTKNYSNYILLLIIVFVCFLILGKTVIDSVNQNTTSSNSNSNSVNILIFILISLIIFLGISYFYRLFR
jgi:hypothetical protein